MAALAPFIPALIGAGAAAGTAAHASRAQKKTTRRGREAVELKQKQDKDLRNKEIAAKGRLRAQEIEAARSRKRLTAGVRKGVENQQLRTKGIAQVGQTFQSVQQNVLNEGAVA